MLVRVRFAKYGVVKFIGHLDAMRYFQKAIRRSGVNIVYSQGFSPHQIMSFASPLGVGITSDAEYMEIELNREAPELMTENPEQTLLGMLQSSMTPGFDILGVKLIGEKELNKRQENAMSLVTAADYMVSWKDGYKLPFNSINELWTGFMHYFERRNLYVNKKTKKSECELDIKPYIYCVSYDKELFYTAAEREIDILGEASEEQGGRTEAFVRHAEYVGSGNRHVISSGVDNTAHADNYQNGMRLFMRLAAGSSMNIKPELVMEDFCHSLGNEYDGNSLQVHRMEMYKGEQELVPLI